MTGAETGRGIWAAAGAWHGGTVQGIALRAGPTGGQLVAATRAGLFTSDDWGAHWHVSGDGITDPNVVTLVAAGTGARQVLFAATATGRLYRHTGAGRALDLWQEVASWAGLGVANVLVPSPAYDDDATLFAGTAEGMLRTVDGGASWESTTFGLLDLEVLCAACAPDFAQSQVLWAGTAGGGLYRSRNRARGWREYGNGLPDAPIQALAVSPAFAGDRTVLAGTEGHGLYRSEDGGETWAPVELGLDSLSVNALLWPDSATLFAGTDAGVLRSDDGGSRWQRVADWIALALSDAGAGRVAAGTYLDGVALATEKGAGWTVLDAPALHAPPVITDEGDEWAALDVDGALAVSGDGGQTWHDMAGPEDALISGVTVARGALWAATDRGLWKRAGDSSVWQHVAAPGLHEHAAVMVEAHSGGAGILAADARGGVFLSRDAGTTWEDASGPWGGQTLLRVMAMPGPNAADAGDLTALTLTPTRAGHYGIFVWRRSAGEWSNIASLATDVPAVLAARSYRSGVFLATQHRVVRLYEDAGEGGTAAAQHFFPEGDQVTALCATGDDSDALWAATSAGLFRTVDAGATWRHMAMLPDARPVVWLRQEGECLAVVTLGGQVWRIRLVDAE